MKSKWMLGAALAAAVGAGSLMNVQAADKKDGKVLLAAKGDKKAGKGKKGNARVMLFSPMMLEKYVGTPLTDDQKKAVKDAADAYNEAVAKALGTTVDDLKAKATQYRKDHPAGGAKKAA